MGRNSIGGKSIVASVTVAAVLAGGAYSWQTAQTQHPTPTNYTIAMKDYAFAPSHMVWHVGDRIVITLVDESQSHPPKEHEFMVGRTPRTAKTAFGIKQEDGFKTPFFTGVTIKLVSGSGLKMLMRGDAKFSGISPKQVMAPGPMGPMEAMTGFMPLLAGSAHLTFSFVVPDRPGRWTYGCFQQSGEHFLNGMKGTIDIVPKASA